jgi:hypothetical protein
MKLADTFARIVTAPVRISLSAGAVGLSAMRGVLEGARRALAHDQSPTDVESPPPPAGAKQVDDEPVPVAEFAETGAEDGAGAEVRVDAPWDGYDSMTATQIAKRLATADSGTAAAVSLYEGTHRSRVSVVAAAERRLTSLDS